MATWSTTRCSASPSRREVVRAAFEGGRRMKWRSLSVVLCLVVAAPLARAEEPTRMRGQGWSFFSNQTAGANATVFGAELGFPGLSLTALRGLQDRFDVGGRFSLVYAFENMPRLIYPGLKAELFGRI